MNPLNRAFILLVILSLGIAEAFAGNVVVGPATCVPTLPHFSTIQAGVNAAASGSTVFVCPGKYREQVVISSPLTLSGVSQSGSSAAIIAVPRGGLVENANSPSFGQVAVQLLVQNSISVAIRNLTIDGAGSGTFCGDTMASIAFLNVGLSRRPGIISNVVVRNGCGDGILSDNSFTSVTSTDVHGTAGAAFTSAGATVQIKSSRFDGGGGGIHLSGNDPFTLTNSIVAGNKISRGGIFLDFIGGVTVADNTIVDTDPNSLALAILLSSASNNHLTNNTMILPPKGTGIELDSFCIGCADTNGNIITGNSVNGGFVGAKWFNSSRNVFQNNLFVGVQTGINIDDGLDGAGSNTVTNNTFNEAQCGIGITTISRTNFAPNTFHNVVSNVCRQ